MLVVDEAGVVEGVAAEDVAPALVDAFAGVWVPAGRGGGALSQPAIARATTAAITAWASGRMIGECRYT